MDRDRRLFVAGAGALLGSALCMVEGARADAGSQGPPQTWAGWQEYLRINASGQFTCVRPVQTIDGPFYFPSSPERRSLAEDRPGLKLRLGVTVSGFAHPTLPCPPLTDALIDIWHTDASSQYSNVAGDIQSSDTVGSTFCRGHQITDEKGYAEFETIVPGWELIAAPPPVPVVRRTTHIHVKVFKGNSVATTQLYLPDPFLATLYADTEPYRTHRLMTAPGLSDRNYARISNTQDPLFTYDHVTPLTLHRKSDMVFATARIGLATENSAGHATLWR